MSDQKDPNKRTPKMPPGFEKPEPRKPKLPPGMEAQSEGRKPTLPPGMKADGEVRKPSLPPGAKKPSLPPGFEGNGAVGDGAPALTKKDYQTDQDVRWCPGCGDYAILSQVQKTLPELGIPKENTVMISGIGCSSRFPYYMKTYGMHSIHGRAPTFATGLKASRPELDVWIITGDGDSLSIGGNHLLHVLRRNVDVQILLFNNQIYGLTKGQYSPTSEVGKITKSTPFGSIDQPLNPASVALGANGSFVARTMDRDPKHMHKILLEAHAHRGTSLIEIYQNCNIFNDGAFFQFTEKATKAESTIFLEHGQPMIFNKGTKGLRLEGFRLEVIDLESGDFSADDCSVHDNSSIELAQIIGQMPRYPELPRPFGVFFKEDRPTYDGALSDQMNQVQESRGKGVLQDLLEGPETWEIEG